MHSIAEIGANVPAFLGKLWIMVEDPATNDLIAWSSSGTSFVIKDEIRFARELLPMYYKHNNMASFIRQLNMYGFHKMVSPGAGSMKMESLEEIEFSHPSFVRGHDYMLENIKRKMGVSKIASMPVGAEKSPQVLNKVLSDVRQMKGRQESMDGRLAAMKMENAALWRELSLLRQKHHKQQQIVNKLIQFLVSIVHQNQNTFTVKRKVFPRMLQHHRSSKNHDHLDVEDCSTSTSTSPGGPIIHELDPAEVLLENVVEEAESNTPITEDPPPELFLNQPFEDEEGGDIDISSQPRLITMKSNNEDVKILGMPEDSLIINEDINQQAQNQNKFVISNASAPANNPSISANVKENPKPKLLRIIPKRPKEHNLKLKVQPRQLIIQRPVVCQQTAHVQPQVNSLKRGTGNKSPGGKKKMVAKKTRQKVNPNLLQNPVGTQNKQIVEKQSEELNVVPGSSLLRTDHSSLLRTDQESVSVKAANSISLLRTGKGPVTSQQLQTSTIPTDVITVPYDSGAYEKILADAPNGTMDSIVLPVDPEEFNIPIAEDFATTTSTPSPAVLSPDPVMTPYVADASPPFLSPPITTPPPAPTHDLRVACMENSQMPQSPSLVTRSGFMLDEMDSHLGTVQSDLDSLKELLRSEGISLDANALLGCFNEDPMSYNIMTNPDSDQSQLLKENNGNELMSYNPSLFDLTDLIGNDWNLPSPGVQEATEEEMFADINTPQFVPQSPVFPTPAKKRKT